MTDQTIVSWWNRPVVRPRGWIVSFAVVWIVLDLIAITVRHFL